MTEKRFDLLGKPLHNMTLLRNVPYSFNDDLTAIEFMETIYNYIIENRKVTNELIEYVNTFFDSVDSKIKKEVSKILNSDEFKQIVGEKIEQLNELLNRYMEMEENFSLDVMEGLYIADLGLQRDRGMQMIQVDDETNQIYGSQSIGGSPESFVITRMSPSGKKLGYMEITGGGHGTLFGIDRFTNGNVKIWFNHTGVQRLVQLEYKDNVTISMGEAELLTDFTPSFLKGSEIYATTDKYFDKVAIWQAGQGHPTIYIYDRKALRVKGDYEHKVDVDSSESDTSTGRLMQGMTLFDDDLYWLSGGTSVLIKPRIQHYKISLNKKMQSQMVERLTYKDGINIFTNGVYESEGLSFHYDPLLKRKSLIMGVDVGGTFYHSHIMYVFTQKSGERHWFNMKNTDNQLYGMTRGNGEVKEFPNSYKDLIDFEKPGHYYIRPELINNISGFPISSKNRGWWVDVEPSESHGNVRQIITRNHAGLRGVSFNRYIYFDSNGVKLATDFEKVEFLSNKQENADPKDYNGLISNITFPGEYYIGETQLKDYNDLPKDLVKNIGLRLYISNGDSSNTVIQTLTRSTPQFNLSFKRVLRKDKSTSEWFVHEDSGFQLFDGSDTLRMDISLFKKLDITTELSSNRVTSSYRTDGATPITHKTSLTNITDTDKKIQVGELSMVINKDKITSKYNIVVESDGSFSENSEFFKVIQIVGYS